MPTYKRIDELSAAGTVPADTDIIEMTYTPSGTPASVKTTVDQLAQATAFSSRYSGAGGGVSNLSYNSSSRVVSNDNGTGFTIPEVSAGGDSGLLTGTDKTKLNNIESAATADQSNAEIETAYNAQVAAVDQSTAEAGTSTTVYRWTPERVKQAIDALAAGASMTDAQVETAYNNRVSVASQILAEEGISTSVVRWTPERIKQAIVALAPPAASVLAVRVSLVGITPPTGSTSVPAVRVRAPAGFTLTDARAILHGAGTSLLTIDIHDGSDVTMLGNKLTIDSGEKTSTTAATPVTIVDGELQDDEEISIYVDSGPSDCDGIVVFLYGNTVSTVGSNLPSEPTSFSALPLDTEVQLTWAAPSDNGGIAIQGYKINYKLNSASTWIEVDVGNTTVTTVTGLTNSSQYNFRVRAYNGNGDGDWTSILNSTPEADATGPPEAPTGLGTVNGDEQVTVSFTEPDDNGEAITDYNIEHRTAAGPGSWTGFSDGTSTSTSIVVTGLTNGIEYEFRVRAVNADGAGPWSTEVSGTPFEPTVPGTPAFVLVVFNAGDNAARLSSAFPSDGGSPITHYDASYILDSSYPGTWTEVPDVGSAPVISPLTGGEDYRFRMRAVNAVGDGGWRETPAYGPVPGS